MNIGQALVPPQFVHQTYGTEGDLRFSFPSFMFAPFFIHLNGK